MKNIVIYSFVTLFLSCAGNQDLSPTETAKIVAESFYQGDETKLKEYTTTESYANFKSLQDMFAEAKNSDSNFKVIDETSDGEVAWVKFTTSYEKKPSIFKLVQEDGQWKVTERKPREEVPF